MKSAPIGEMRDDLRGLCINDTVFGYSLSGGASMDEHSPWDIASMTASQPTRAASSDDEVFQRAMKAWQDAQSGKFNRGAARRAVVRTTRDEIERLPGDALKLLSKLRADTRPDASAARRSRSQRRPWRRRNSCRAIASKRRARFCSERASIEQVAPLMNDCRWPCGCSIRLVLLPLSGGRRGGGAV